MTLGQNHPMLPIAVALLLCACGDCHSSGGQSLPSVMSSSPSVSTVPSVSAVSKDECEPICSEHFMYSYRFDRLCGQGEYLFDSRWYTPACTAAEVQRNDSLRYIYRPGKPDGEGPLCRCGELLPHHPLGKHQVSGPRCDSLCEEAEGMWSRMERECQTPPWLEGYDKSQCYGLEERFFKLRPQIFECWCSRVSRSQRMLHGTLP